MAKAQGKAGTVITSPHIHAPVSVNRIMWVVVFALLPAAFASVYFFGMNSVRIITISLVTAVVTEFLMNLVTKSRVTVHDGSAVITGLLFAFNLPPASPWYLVVVGSFFSIAIVKWAFGGLGYNFMNPALGGRIFVLAAWPAFMLNHWSPTIQKFTAEGLNFTDASAKIVGLDAVTSATPLTALKTGGMDAVQAAGFNNYWDLFIGNIPGSIGETSALALLIGALILIALRVISWHIPFIYIGTVAVLTWIFGGLPQGLDFFSGDPLFHVLSGGLMLGAFFMATDPVTSPISVKGRVVFAVFLGVCTSVIRLWGSYPEGVSYAIVFMNIFVPLIDRFTKERIYGAQKKNAAKPA
jgi:Na+-translocating ferredoxin:NAD+ oxidoreductase subunit D